MAAKHGRLAQQFRSGGSCAYLFLSNLFRWNAHLPITFTEKTGRKQLCLKKDTTDPPSLEPRHTGAALIHSFKVAKFGCYDVNQLPDACKNANQLVA